MTEATSYTDFLKQKIRMASFKGFDVPMEQINPFLKPHTREIVQWAVQGGNRAIKKGRTGGGSELNPTYFMDQVHYLRAAEKEVSMPSLFALEEAEIEMELEA